MARVLTEILSACFLHLVHDVTIDEQSAGSVAFLDRILRVFVANVQLFQL